MKKLIDKHCFGIVEIRPGRKPELFATYETKKEAQDECNRCQWKGDFSYEVVEVSYVLYGGFRPVPKFISMGLPFGA